MVRARYTFTVSIELPATAEEAAEIYEAPLTPRAAARHELALLNVAHEGGLDVEWTAQIDDPAEELTWPDIQT